MKKILFALKDMNVGGVEKSLVSLLEEIDCNKYDVTLLLLKDFGGFMNQIPNWVKIIFIKEYTDIESLVNNPPLSEIKKCIKKKEYVFSLQLFIGYLYFKFTRNMAIYYYFVFKNIPKINDSYDVAIAYSSLIPYLTYFVNSHIKANKKYGWIHFDVKKLVINKNTLYVLHKNLDRIYVVSREALESFIDIFPKLKDKCELKYNVISRSYIERQSRVKVDLLDSNSFKIITLGRISKEKGQDIIPNIVKNLLDKNYDIKWYLIGDGKLIESIKKSMENLKLNNEIVFLGTKINPYPYLKQADLYVQPSRYEGYCISLAEAKTLYLPIVTTDFAGAKEQITHRFNGSIVRFDEVELFNEIKLLIDDNNLRNLYKENLRKS